MSELIIREATASDCQQILALMQESAREQNGTSTSKLTCQDLMKDAFRSSPPFTLYVCQTFESQVVGYILFYYSYSTWVGHNVYIEELFVLPSFRRRGIASALWKKVIQTALKNGCSRCDLTAQVDNKFLFSQGATDKTKSEKWLLFKMYKDSMEDLVKNCKSVTGIEIRDAARNDSVEIRKLVQDLADYIRLPNGPKIDASVLEEDGHGDRIYYKCFVAERNDVLVGYSLFFYTYNMDGLGTYMEDLYVSPEYRRQGLGTALWGSGIKECLNLGGSHCEFAVLESNTASIDFYKLKGAHNMAQERGIHFYKMSKDVMEKYVRE